MNQKTQRLWLHPDGYRITWRKEAYGVPVLARYHACVKILVPGAFENGYTEMWDFVKPGQTYRSMKTAVADCKKHVRQWSRATQCSGIQAVQEIFGCVPRAIPKWAVSKLNGRVFKTLLDIKLCQNNSVSEPVCQATGEIGFVYGYPANVATGTSGNIIGTVTTIKKRKPRSDKGKPRGPRKQKEHTND